MCLKATLALARTIHSVTEWDITVVFEVYVEPGGSSER